MTFNKPENITYTQMAQWVDANISQPDSDESKMCEYIYHLVVLRAKQLSLFKELDQLDDFSIYCTSKLLKRIQKGTLANVKSICNYIRTVIVPWKSEYIREFCTGSAELAVADFDVTDFSDYLIDETSLTDYKSYKFSCVNTTDVLRKHIKQIPRKRKSAEWSNIYTSCLLTLQNRIRVAAKLCEKFDVVNHPEQTNLLIRELKKSAPILYHVDENVSNYVTTLVNEMIHALATEISHTTMSTVSVSACMRNLVAAASTDEDE